MFSMKKLIVIIPMLAVALTGCATGADNAPTPKPSVSATATATPTPEPEADATDAPATPTTFTAGSEVKTTDMLAVLPVAVEAKSDTYNRDFFKHWVSKNNTGCDTRFAVLEEEAVSGFAKSGCDVTKGEWFSEYEGATVTKASTLDVDHMVPLAEAWRSGASEWDSATREAYANDLSNPNALIAVTASSNRSKSDDDPNNWMPDTDACVYLSKWVGVKYEWKLTLDQAEKDDIVKFLSFCDVNTMTTVYDAPVTVPTAAAPTTPEAGQSAAPAEPTTDAPATNNTPVAPVAPAPVDAPVTTSQEGNAPDQQFTSCSEATANGFGPYVKGRDVEYDYYRDGDGDGTVCE